MRLRGLLLSALLGLPALAGPAVAQLSVPEADGNGYYVTRWGGEGSAELNLVWRPVLHNDGTVLVCGVWTVNNELVRDGVRNILSRAVVLMDGSQVHRGLRRFARSPTKRAMERTAPGCVRTEARGPWSEIAIVFGNGDVRG